MMIRALVTVSTLPAVYLGASLYWLVAAEVIGKRLDLIRLSSHFRPPET
jgi:hypothetical protein